MAKKKQQKISQIKKYNLATISIIIIIIGIAIYSHVLNSPFVFDDHDIILKSNELKSGAIYTHFNQARYIGYVTFAINYHLNKLNTFGYHLVNLIIHILNSILVYLLVQKILLIIQNQTGPPFRREIPLIIALIFLVHPVQTQAVTYIAQRFTSLAAFFSLTAILSYLEFKTAKTKPYFYLILSFIACLLAFKTKENTATLPFIIIAIELILFKDRKFTNKKIMHVLPFFILFAVIPLSFIPINQPAGELLGELTKASYQTEQVTRTQYLFTEFRVIVTYICLLIFPIHQSIDYYYALSQSFFDTKTFLSFLFLSMLFIFSLIISNKYHVISFGIIWFFIFLAVESSIIPIKDVIFEHRIYLPSIGFFIALVYAMFLLDKRFKLKKILFIIFIAIIISLAIAAYSRNKFWNNEETLWEDAATKFPRNPRAVSNFGGMLADNNKCPQAIPLLNKSIEMAPNNPKNWFLLAYCHRQAGLLDDAIKEYSKVLELSPGNQKATIHLADIYLQKRDFDSAYSILIKAQESFPGNLYINASLAHIKCETGDLTDALTSFDDAAKAGLDQASTYFNFAVCLLNHGNYLDSRKYFFKALELDPGLVDVNYFIAVTYDTAKDFQKAVFFYQQFLSRSTRSSWIPEARQRLEQLKTGSSL